MRDLAKSAAARRPLKHLILCREYPPAPYPAGGIGTYARHIGRLLAEAGETVHIIAQGWDGAPEPVVRSVEGRLILHRIPLDKPLWPAGSGRPEKEMLRGLAASDCPSQVFSWQAARYAERLIEEEGIDVIEAQEWEAPLYQLQLRRRLGLGPDRQPPCVVHLHSPTQMIFEHNEWDKTLVDYLPLSRFEEFTIRSADSLICPSHYLANGVSALFGLEEESVTIVRYPMGETPVLARNPEVWKRDAICYVGRLELRKGVVEWIDAAIQVAATHRSVSFDFFGSDTSLDGANGESVLASLKRRIPRSLRTRFHFHGSQSREQLLQSLATFSIAVVPSRWENLPYTCIEAMATGLPVIVSPHGGMSELISDGDSGWVARDGSPEGLAEALTRALSVPAAERAAMGASAAAAVRRLCANDVVVQRHLEHRSEAVEASLSRRTVPPAARRLVEEPIRVGKLARRRFSGMALIQNPSAGFAFAWFLAAPLGEKARWISRVVLHPRRIVRWMGWQMRQRVPEPAVVAAALAAPTAAGDEVHGR
jgi:glycosyltransferase involved in cell wall biosynthesis